MKNKDKTLKLKKDMIINVINVMKKKEKKIYALNAIMDIIYLQAQNILKQNAINAKKDALNVMQQTTHI